MPCSGLTIGDTAPIGLERASAGIGPDIGALMPNPNTVAVFEAARRGEVVEPGRPAEAIAELDRDD